MCAAEEELVARNKDCDEHVSKEHAEDAEYYLDLYGDVIACEE